eukprot:366266-Chlamydomonas_euryale.AAC.3
MVTLLHCHTHGHTSTLPHTWLHCPQGGLERSDSGDSDGSRPSRLSGDSGSAGPPPLPPQRLPWLGEVGGRRHCHGLAGWVAADAAMD